MLLLKVAIIGQLGLKTDLNAAIFPWHRPTLVPLLILLCGPILTTAILLIPLRIIIVVLVMHFGRLFRGRVTCHGIVGARWAQNLRKISRLIIFLPHLRGERHPRSASLVLYHESLMILLLVLRLAYRIHCLFEAVRAWLRSLIQTVCLSYHFVCVSFGGKISFSSKNYLNY